MTKEQKLIEKLQRIEALFAGAATTGEKVAASNARSRIQERLKEVQKLDPPVEYKFTIRDVWSKKLFLADSGATALSLTATVGKETPQSWLEFLSVLSRKPCGQSTRN